MQHYNYSVFGKILSITDGNGNDVTDTPPVASLFTYTGREWDSESGLYYYRARSYDPNIGRFLQVDPAAGALINPITHINKYAYVGNNPINRIDPSGCFSISKAIGLGVALGLIDPFNVLKWADEHSNQVLGAALIVGGAFVSGATFGGAAPLGAAMMGAGWGLANTEQGASFEDIEANMLTGAVIGVAVAVVPGGFFAKVGAGVSQVLLLQLHLVEIELRI